MELLKEKVRNKKSLKNPRLQRRKDQADQADPKKQEYSKKRKNFVEQNTSQENWGKKQEKGRQAGARLCQAHAQVD